MITDDFSYVILSFFKYRRGSFIFCTPVKPTEAIKHRGEKKNLRFFRLLLAVSSRRKASADRSTVRESSFDSREFLRASIVLRVGSNTPSPGRNVPALK